MKEVFTISNWRVLIMSAFSMPVSERVIVDGAIVERETSADP
jgi:hypothetical protein